MKICNFLFTFAVMMLMAAMCMPATAVIKVACLGNSITYGFSINNESERYPARLQALLGDNYEVRNFGCNSQTVQMLGRDSGESSQPGSCAYRNKSEYRNALAYNPDIVVLKLGTNDSKPCNWLDDSPERFRSDLNDMLDEINSRCGNPKIYLCYPIRIKQDVWGINERNLHTIIELLHSVADERGIDIINLHTAFEEELGDKWNTVYNDGVHPDAQGAAIIARKVADAILNGNLGDPDDYLHPVVACIGGARTIANAGVSDPAVQAYPYLLGQLLGTRYVVSGYGVAASTILRKGTKQDPSQVPDSPSAAYIDTPTFQTLLGAAPDIVIINLGESESCAWNWLHKADLADDLGAMVEALREAKPSVRIYLCIPPRMRNNRNNGTMDGSVYANEVVPALREAAATLDLPVIDAADLMNDEVSCYSGYFYLSSTGHGRLAELMARVIGDSSSALPETFASTPAGRITLIPNPVRSGSQVAVSAQLSSPARLTITSLGGVTMQSAILTPELPTFTPVLPTGIYVWTLTDRTTLTASGKLIVL